MPDDGRLRQAKSRRSIRLPGYDYASPGAYFVTVCAHARTCLFGEIDAGQMTLNLYGSIARSEWLRSAQMRREIELDEFIVVPNHIHAIVSVVQRGRGDRPVAPTGPRPASFSSLLAGFKASATKRVNQARGTPGAPVWQRNYYERVIRNEDELRRIREYIHLNPLQWELDRENPNRIPDLAHARKWAWLEGEPGRTPRR